jgi:hypothetical protein
LHHLPALSAPTLQVSSDFHQFALIFIDLHWFSSICPDFIDLL